MQCDQACGMSVCALVCVCVFLCQEKMTHFSSVASFFKLLTCARSQSLSACPLIRRERKGEEAEDGQRSHGRTLRLDHCTEKACFFFFVFNPSLAFKSI